MEKAVVRTIGAFRYVSMGLIFILMFMGFTDVILRYFFNSPISGVKELGVCFLPIITAFALAGTQMDNGHIRIELLYNLFKPRFKKGADIITTIAAILLWLLFAYQSIKVGNTYIETGRYIEIIRFPVWILQYASALGCFLLVAELMRELFRNIKAPEVKEVNLI